MAGEADDDGERRPVGTVDRDHADRVVHRPLRDDPVDGDPRRAAGPEPHACGRQRARGGVDDAGDRLRQELGVAGEGRRIAEPGDAAATGEARRAVVVARVDEHGLRRDAGQGRDALAHRGREIGAGEDEVRRDDRERCAPVVDHERLRDERIVNALRETRTKGPAAVREAARRSDVGARDAGPEFGHRCSLLPLTIGSSAPRRSRDAAF